MPVQRQTLNIPFAQGLDTKNDPWQIQPGNFLTLENALFQRGNALRKRAGFEALTSLPSVANATTLTTYKNNLTALGESLYAFSDASDQWINKGRMQPISLSSQSTVRTAYSISVIDSCVSTNDLVCTAFLDGDSVWKYTITSFLTGETLINVTNLPATASAARVHQIGNFFVITFFRAGALLSYIAIPIANLTSVIGPTNLSAAATTAYDAHVVGSELFVAWTDGANMRVTKLSATLQQGATYTILGYTATRVSVTGYAPSVGLPTIWVTAYNGVDAFSWTLNSALTVASAAFQTMTAVTSTEITSIADVSGLTLFYQVTNTYTFSSQRTDFIRKVTCTPAGVITAPVTIQRDAGIGSEAFIYNDRIYLLAAHNGTNQPTYFLIDSDSNIVAKLAYSNGAGYCSTQILPSVHVLGDNVSIAYLYKTLVIPVNKTQGTNAPNGVYAQIGGNLVTFNMSKKNVETEELAQVLAISGGYVWMYDTVKPVELGFHVWPDEMTASPVTNAGSITSQQYYYQVTYEWTDGQGLIHRSAPSIPLSFLIATPPATFTGDTILGSNIITDISSFTGLQVGQRVTAAHLPVNTFITAINAPTNIIVSNNATATQNNMVITPTAVSTVLLNIPTLRFTNKKSPDNVRIVIYRWSTAQQVYYQITSVTSPLLNNSTIDSVTFLDTQSDSQILGNNVLYTTGGVVENIAPPASSLVTTFNNRMFAVSDEDRNTIWYSKQVLASTPIEFSDLFTIYVAPTSTAQGDPGEITAIAAMDDKLIVFKSNTIYYIAGNGPDITGANNDFSDPVFITGTVGCINANSIVYTPNGIFFQSNKGIWVLNRNLTTEYVGAPVEGYNAIPVADGLTIPDTNEVRMSIEPGVSMAIYNGRHALLNANGDVLLQTSNTYIDDASAGLLLMYDYYYQQWGTFRIKTGPVQFAFVTGWLSLAGIQGFERAQWMTILGRYYSPHKLSISIGYDYNDSPTQSLVLTSQNWSPNYGNDPLYGNGSPFGGPGNVEQWRVFFNQQKCQSFQLRVQEIFDPQYSTVPGSGVQLTGINLIVGLKSTYNRMSAAQQRS